MAEVLILDSSIKVKLRVSETIGALRRSFEIPLKDVRGATTDNSYIKPGWENGLGFRSPGTGFPGLIAEGTFRKDGQKVLSLWRKGQDVVVIELANSKWDRLVIGSSNADDLTLRLNAALNN